MRIVEAIQSNCIFFYVLRIFFLSMLGIAHGPYAYWTRSYTPALVFGLLVCFVLMKDLTVYSGWLLMLHLPTFAF